ncbi:uncharacterized protein LOC129807664 isoform X2 [Phlebotomus papatasi]|uniref:uncharacterized protein LOC129807664 isoform X2 n=1 Tax=Phlebotomus papatasi TaxID=29031 RepID=UPI002483F1E4|nr:uncharacterized protein LOC129807664 isoform X2 [Phlebotomus papatasi]XP_055713061.1 uncharacterized protein LOC129807664 isoform X2 [Phlebotomus papatasi]
MRVNLVTNCIFVLAISGFVAGGRRNPLKDPAICGRPECDDSNWKFMYEPSIIYRYDYSLHVRTQFSGSGENTSDVHLIGGVELIFPKKCEGLLRVLSLEVRDRLPVPTVSSEMSRDKDSAEFDEEDYEEPEEIELHPRSYELAEEVSKYELRFSFQDGLIGEICPHDEESSWVLNLKRGILSAFQNTMTRFDIDHHATETDVSGVCDVKYVLEGSEETSLIIMKTKNTGSCRNRYKTHSILQTTSYEFRRDYSAWPIIQTQSYCNISVDHSIYNNVKCYERHQLVPFSNNQSGAVTESTLHLKLSDEVSIEYSVDDDFLPIYRRSSLLFDHVPAAKPTHGEIKASREYLKQMCKLGFPDIQRDFPDVLMKFLSNVRLLTYNALQQLLARAGSICDNGKNHVLDSLPYIGSTASVLLMRDQIVRNAIDAKVAQDWISSIAYITHPDEEVMGAMLTLIEYGKSVKNPSAILSATAVVHSFCKYHSECGTSENVRKIIDYLEHEIMTGMNQATHTRKDKEDLLVALKGLGNIGVISEHFEEVLEELIEDHTISIDVRLQAIYVFRRLDCDKSKDYFLSTYGNFTEYSEIRIAAYLQTMKCPDYQSIEFIRDVLVREEVNQVGSFVWSHLTNLAKSSSPVRVEAQGLIVDGDLGTKYKMDIRKFSRNFEHSVFFNEYNLGANVDSNLIFGTDSYLPRTMSLNFTADLFGESVNLLEISGRTEGFEHYFETIFGPKGPLNTEKFREKFSFLGNYWKDSSISSEEDDLNFERLNMKIKRDSEGGEDDSEEIEDTRKKREVAPKYDLENSVNDLGYKLKYKFSEPKAAFGLKVFGNDLKYYTIEGFGEVAKAASKLNPMEYITDLLSGREITYTKSGIFLDVSYEIPMSSGVPLSLAAQGASSIDIRMSGLLRGADFVKTRHFNIEGRVKPSVSVDIITTMQADIFYANTGIKVKSNLYSSSSVEAKLKVRGTKLVSLQLSIPQNRSDIFSARSQLLVIKHDQVLPQRGIEKRYENQTCTWPVIDRAIGLKLCTEYSLPDGSNSTGLPNFFFTGPINIDIHVDKADPTAKIFLFEFRWDTNANGSVGSFVFETPGSKIPRIFSANLTTSDIENALTMSFKNAATSYAAVGTYKNTENEKNIEVYLDINGQKSLSLEMGYNRSEIKNGFMFYPRFFLTVNNEKIAGLGGMLKLTNKKDVSQWDVNLVFETKRLQAKLSGYITETEASVSTKLAMEYRFLDQKVERLEFQGDIANRSQKARTDYQGSAKLKTTAYEKYNFASNMKYVSAMGHAEWRLNFNNAKDLINPDYNLGVRMIFARFHHIDNGRTTASIEITRPVSKTDLKFMIKYEEKAKNGSEHNILVLARYAPQKEITGVLSLLFPRRQLFAVDAALNLTVPAFDSCTINLKLYEKTRKEYNIDFKGKWFSGHSMTALGKYEDRSSSIKTFHHIKLSIQSPSFQDTLIDARYSRDEYEVVVDCQVDYGGYPYGVSLKYSEQSPYETYTNMEVKWKDRLYWLSANMTSEQPKQLIVEIHLDKFRDIHVILRCLNNEQKKEAGIEVKWDANRDPTQKLAIFGEFNTPKTKFYDGRFVIAYPERTFSGTFDYRNEDAICKANARLGWSSYEAIELKYESGNLPGPIKDIWTTIIINTPFDGWRQNSINTGLHYNNNLLLLNGSVVWGENYLGAEFMGDYEIKDPIFGCEFRTALNSSIAIMPTFSIHFKHRHDDKKVDTDATVKHTAYNESSQTYSIKSAWQFDVNSEYQNVSGSVAFRSPFENYTTGALVTKFSLNDKRQLKGAADLDLEEKKFTLAVEGHIKKITDNMLVVNITTPIERFRNIIGRFGINERNRHIVAEVRAPKDALGVELLFLVHSFTNFDIKFHLATPLEAFEKVLLIALMQNDHVDFRGGWNKVVLGFVGVWKFDSFLDFEYSYKVYTPLENFEENGLVVRLMKTDNELDTECSFKLAQYKVGYKLVAKPKPILIRQLRLKNVHNVIKDLFSGEEDFSENPEEEEDEEDNEDYSDEDEYLNFIAYLELDTIIFPTLKGNLDVEEVDDTYYCFGTMILPQGIIEVRDKFYFPDYMTHKNTLKIVTPFAKVREIKSNYQMKIDLRGHNMNYLFGLDFNYLNSVSWIESGLEVNYSKRVDPHELSTHDIRLKFKTPLEMMPFLNLDAFLEIEDSNYKVNLTGSTNTTQLSVFGNLDLDETYMDGSLGMSLVAPLVPSYMYRVFFKRDSSTIDNTFDLGFDTKDSDTANNLHIWTSWRKDDLHYVSAKGKIRTTFLKVKMIDGTVLITRKPHPLAVFRVGYQTQDGMISVFLTRAQQVDRNVELEINSPLGNYRNISLHGTLSQTATKGQFIVHGHMNRSSNLYHVSGNLHIREDVPIFANIVLTPISGEANCSMLFILNDVKGGNGHTFQAKIEQEDKFLQVGGGISYLSRLNWRYALTLASSEPEIGKVNMNCSLLPDRNGRLNGNFELNSPWNHLGLEQIQLDSWAKVTRDSGEVYSSYHLPSVNGDSKVSWSWVILENMQIFLENRFQRSEATERFLATEFKYVNPNRNQHRLQMGGSINVDNVWRLETNTSLSIPSSKDISMSATIRLPQPVGDIHQFFGKYRGNIGTNDPNMEINYEARYEAFESKKRLASRGQFRNVSDLQGFLRVEWGPNVRQDGIEAFMQMLRKGIRKEFAVRVATPLHAVDTLKASGSYDYKDIYHVVAGRLFVPSTRQIADADVSFSSLSNTKGIINSTTPFFNLTWIRADFDFLTKGGESNRFIKATWPTNFAVYDSKSVLKSVNLNRDFQGTIKLEVPIESRHFANIVYGLKERPMLTTGNAVVEYNNRKVLDGTYNCKTESRAGFEKETVNIALENNLKPIGIHYVHQRQSAGPDDPDYDMKHAELFELRNSKIYNITGELHVRTTITGQEYKILAIHPNRTVIFTSEYDYQNSTTKQKSKLQLAPSVWIAYDWQLQNLSRADNESQVFSIEVSYPKRNLGASGWYAVTDDAFDSDVSLNWSNQEDEDPKIMRAGLEWRSHPLTALEKDNQTCTFSIGHPSFNEDVTFKGLWYRSENDLLKTHLVVNYCDDPEHELRMGIELKDWTNIVGYKNYSYLLYSWHEISELDLHVAGSLGLRPGLYNTINNGRYKRGYLPLSEGIILGLIDVRNKELNYHRASPSKSNKLWAKADGFYPIYTLNGSLEDTPDTDTNMRFIINFDDKFVKMNVNLTPDATQNIQMFGSIPDSRSASFYFLRDYEDIRVVDVSSYIRMNHSRLVTSKIIWRPKIKADLKNFVKKTVGNYYDAMADDIDYWVKTIFTETNETIKDVWYNARQYTEYFLEDVGELKFLEEDLEKFHNFLNASYEANDFYVRSVVNFTLTIIDELAIRNHIESVPKILQELWHVMGESGQALRRSIIWLKDTIKESYKNLVDMISKILHGESLEHISSILGKAVEKYDKFIKDLHLSLIKYVENLYTRLTDMLASYWKKILQNIEPSIIKFAHYVEMMMWNVSKEVFDFLYKRTNEFAESPYFNKVSNFTQDLDRVYKDFVQNDAITNIKKYSVIMWQFLKDKYFKFVPFGKELHEVYLELWEEIKGLKKLETVQFFMQKVSEVQNKIMWVIDELEVEKRLQQVLALLKSELLSFAQTALQADDRNREAKTKFIFDPDTGLIELEQKLPMSWHAFNETPKFEEIPEYKLIHDTQNFFTGTNFSIWMAMYEIKRQLDPHIWFPPYKSSSLLIGSRHYMTFDRKFVELNVKYGKIEQDVKPDQCSYLLARDWLDYNFTLILEPSINTHGDDLISARKLSLLTENEVIYIDILGHGVRIGNNIASLPALVGDTVIYRDSDVIYLHSDKGFDLACNLQFDICTLELSGWYFGKTAGLLGTMNNEMADDFTTNRDRVAKSEDEFIRSWALNECHQTPEYQTIEDFSDHNTTLCDVFFKNKISYFSPCFSVVDSSPFLEMCVDLSENSIENVIDVKHPSPRGACTAALAYIEACNAEKTLLRVPDVCVFCELNNGSFVPEGTFLNFQEEVAQSTDVVFIVEAKECNKNLLTTKSLSSVVNALQKEFLDAGITDNRYSVVAFGGDIPFDKPRSIVVNNEVFTEAKNLPAFFDYIESGNGTNKDIFQAISVAAKLIFRPGVSKTFILLPCSECKSSDSKFDYSSLLQLLLENGIKLHILMDQEIVFDKGRAGRMFFGMDRDFAFTKKDLHELKGDTELRKQVRLPKATLGLCTPLAIESSGSVFSARKLRPERKSPVKKFSTVFAKRVAKTATPADCQTCECTGHNSGIAYVVCYPCSYPNPTSWDYGFSEESTGTDLDWNFDDEDYNN